MRPLWKTALLCLLDNRNLNVEQVRAGHSHFWTKYGRGRYAKDFIDAEKENRKEVGNSVN